MGGLPLPRPAARRSLAAVACAASLAAAAPAAAQEEAAPRSSRRCAARDSARPAAVGDSLGRLTGRVVDAADGASVGGAEVRLPRFSAGVVTDGDGRFTFAGVPPGSHLVSVRHPSYGDHTNCVDVVPGRSVRVALVVPPRPLAVDSLRVAVEDTRPRWLERTGFYRRRATGGGIFFGPDDIERRNPSRLSFLFRGKSGVEVDDGELKPRHAPSTMLTTPDCPVQFFVNGRRMELPLGIDTYQSGDVAAIEAYFGESGTPPQFNTGRAACGAVVLWLSVRP